MVDLYFNMDTPLYDIFPSSWKDEIGIMEFMEFRNLDHFKACVSKITQKQDDYCGVTYSKALQDLLNNKAVLKNDKKESLREEVRDKLHKRGLITEEVYEKYKYTDNGTQVGIDVGRYAAGDPECVITPTRQYIDYFYELYVNISYPYHITNEQIQDTVIRMLAAIEELERQHIFIKITLVLPIAAPSSSRKFTFFSVIPLFSHKEQKSVETMSVVLNDRLLRKFYFALLENQYGDNLYSSYGQAKSLKGTFNIGDDFDPVTFVESIRSEVSFNEH